MPFPQVGTFGSTPVIAFNMTLSRGPRSSCCHLRVPHYQNQDISEDTDLILQSNTGPVTFAGMTGDISTVRPDFGPDHRREWIFTAWDRRQQWSKKSGNVEANVRYRDGTVKPSTQKTLSELYDLLLVFVGEPAGSKFDASAYPRLSWKQKNAVDGFDQLASLYPAYICRENNDSFSVRQTGDGMTLPEIDGQPSTIPDYQATIEVGPKTINLLCGPTLFQCFLTLEAVGRDTDGSIKLINDLSYKPSGGWEKEDPQFFAGVAIGDRHLALKTVYRMYRVAVQSVPGCTSSISQVQQFFLEDTLVSMGGTGDDKFEIPAFVKGCFYPYSDRFVNTGSCVHWAGDFTIDKYSRCVVFDVPVYKAGSCIAPADLYLCTGFKVMDLTGNTFARKSFTITRDTGNGEQTLCHDEMYETQIVAFTAACSNSSPTDNDTVLQAEADIYLNAWKDHWDKQRDHHDIVYSGTLPLSLSGNIAQITYELFGGDPPSTRASTYEHEAMLR